jgi:hypothetical protein
VNGPRDLERDPREYRLPGWEKDRLELLRLKARAQWRRHAVPQREVVVVERFDPRDLSLLPLHWVGNQRVSFWAGPADDVFRGKYRVDVWVTREGRLLLYGGGRLRVTPAAVNVVEVAIED